MTVGDKEQSTPEQNRLALLGLKHQEAPEDRMEPDHMVRVSSRQRKLGRTGGGLGFPTDSCSRLQHGQNSLARKGTVAGEPDRRWVERPWLWEENLGERPRWSLSQEQRHKCLKAPSDGCRETRGRVRPAAHEPRESLHGSAYSLTHL